MLENLYYLLTKVFCNIIVDFITLIDTGFYRDITANDANSHQPIKETIMWRIGEVEREKYSGILGEVQSTWEALECVLICWGSSRMSLLYFYSLLEEYFC